jgi:hypothetical protein
MEEAREGNFFYIKPFSVCRIARNSTKVRWENAMLIFCSSPEYSGRFICGTDIHCDARDASPSGLLCPGIFLFNNNLITWAQCEQRFLLKVCVICLHKSTNRLFIFFLYRRSCGWRQGSRLSWFRIGLELWQLNTKYKIIIFLCLLATHES